MRCNTCGRQIQNETANFCEYCGASFREQAQAAPMQGFEAQSYNRQMMPEQQQYGMPGYQQNTMPGYQQNTQPNNVKESPISFLNWLASYLLLFIPFANIIILVIWAFSYNSTPTKKNWARATLIFMLIIFIIFIMYSIYFMGTPEFQYYMKQYGGTLK